jgi:hypothetical protein
VPLSLPPLLLQALLKVERGILLVLFNSFHHTISSSFSKY